MVPKVFAVAADKCKDSRIITLLHRQLKLLKVMEGSKTETLENSSETSGSLIPQTAFA